MWQRMVPFSAATMMSKMIIVTGSGKTGLIATITDIHFLPVRESCTHALPRNTKYLIIDGQMLASLSNSSPSPPSPSHAH